MDTYERPLSSHLSDKLITFFGCTKRWFYFPFTLIYFISLHSVFLSGLHHYMHPQSEKYCVFSFSELQFILHNRQIVPWNRSLTREQGQPANHLHFLPLGPTLPLIAPPPSVDKFLHQASSTNIMFQGAFSKLPYFVWSSCTLH